MRIKIIIALLLFFNFGCNNIKNINSETSGIEFFELFSKTREFIIEPNHLNSLIDFKYYKKNYILSDYVGKKVILVDSNGNYLKDILNDHIAYPVKIINPLAISISDNRIYISDNSPRRIYVLDSNLNYLKRFILPGNHMSPTQISNVNNNLYLSGYDKNTSLFLHKYDSLGRFILSFKSAFDGNSKYFSKSAVNYIWTSIYKNELYCVELNNYVVEKYDLEGNLLIQKRILPDYFIELTDSLSSSTQDYINIREKFSKLSSINIIGDKILIQIEMPVNGDNTNYFNSRNFKLDILDLNLNPLITGVEFGNKKIVDVDENGNIYVINHHNKITNSFNVEVYKLKI
jgi:hypothetical protein